MLKEQINSFKSNSFLSDFHGEICFKVLWGYLSGFANFQLCIALECFKLLSEAFYLIEYAAAVAETARKRKRDAYG
jgi:hypothetical protein